MRTGSMTKGVGRRVLLCFCDAVRFSVSILAPDQTPSVAGAGKQAGRQEDSRPFVHLLVHTEFQQNTADYPPSQTIMLQPLHQVQKGLFYSEDIQTNR